MEQDPKTAAPTETRPPRHMRTLPITSDGRLERAVVELGDVMLEGLPKGVGCIFDASRIRWIVYDLLHDTAARAAALEEPPPSDFELLGGQIDRLDNLVGALKLPLSPQIHITQLKLVLPEISATLKEFYEKATGENPWD